MRRRFRDGSGGGGRGSGFRNRVGNVERALGGGLLRVQRKWEVESGNEDWRSGGERRRSSGFRDGGGCRGSRRHD